MSAETRTNVPWARLTMPPMPVTTTNDRKISERVRPDAITPTQKSLARNRMYTIRNAIAIVPGERPAPPRQVGEVVGGRGFVGGRTTSAAALSGHHHETDQEQEERHRGC